MSEIDDLIQKLADREESVLVMAVNKAQQALMTSPTEQNSRALRAVKKDLEDYQARKSGGEAVRSDDLLDAVESLRVRLSDCETLAMATLAYYRETNSTAATVALLRCRELLEQIASNDDISRHGKC